MQSQNNTTKDLPPTPYDRSINDADDSDPFIRAQVLRRQGYRQAQNDYAELVRAAKWCITYMESQPYDALAKHWMTEKLADAIARAEGGAS